MLATATLALPADTACDTVAVGLFEGKGIPHDIDGAMQALVDSGEARPSYRHLGVTHAAGKRLMPDLQPIMKSADVQEGLRAFMERRPGTFEGR